MSDEMDAVKLAMAMLAKGDDPPLYGPNTIALARALLAAHAQIERMRMALGAIQHLGTLQINGVGSFERGLAKGYSVCGKLAAAGLGETPATPAARVG